MLILTIKSRWLDIWPEAPVTATLTVFCQFFVSEGSSYSNKIIEFVIVEPAVVSLLLP